MRMAVCLPRGRSPCFVGWKDGDNMSMLLDIHVEANLLNIVASGEFSLGEAERTFVQMLNAVELHQSKKVLFDGRKLVGNPKIIERFYYGQFAAQSVAEFRKRGLPRDPQFAYILKEPVLDPERFGETVAVNRGMNVKAFGSLAEALRWLGIAPVDKPDAGDGERRT